MKKYKLSGYKPLLPISAKIFLFLFFAFSSVQAQNDYTLKFDGSNDYLDAGNFNVGGTQLTLSAWVKPTAFGDDPRIISKATGTDVQDHYFLLGFDDISSSQAKIRFRLKTNGTTHQLHTSSTVAVGDWMHLAAVYNGSSMKIYVNGELEASMNKSGNVDTNSNVAVWMGGNPPNSTDRPFKGFMDEVRVYGKALSQTQIKERMYSSISPSDILYPDLISYWKFNDGMNQYATDEKTNNQARLGSTIYPDVNDPQWSSVKNPAMNATTYGLNFDGVDDYVDVGNFAVQGKLLTLTAWFKADQFGTDPRIISKSTDVYSQKFQLGFDDVSSSSAKIRFRIGNNELTSSTTVAPGQWHHVAATYDGNIKGQGVNMKIYLDGVLIATKSGVHSNMSNSSHPVWIGANPNNASDRPFDGVLDEVSVWKTALSESEIQQIMFNNIDNTHSKWNKLVSYWKFNEGSGQSVSDEKNNNNGTLGSGSGTDSKDPSWIPPGCPTGIEWAGTLNTDANQSNNWSNNTIPVNTSVVIPATDNDPIVTTDMQLGNVTVESNASITVPVGKTLTVNGDLVLKADATGTADIDIQGDLVITGTAKVEKYQHKDKHHYIAAPVSDQNVSLYSDAPKFKNYDPTSPQWDANFSGNFELVRGYVVKYGDNTVKQFQGNMNLGNTYNYSVSSSNYGWNLVGNPYPFVIDADALISTNNAGSNPLITGTLWFWAEGDDYYSTDYSTYTPVTGGVSGYQGGPVPNNKIAPGQGFFVQALRNGTFEVNRNMKTTGDAQFYNAERTVQRAWFNLQNKNMNYGDYNELFNFLFRWCQCRKR